MEGYKINKTELLKKFIAKKERETKKKQEKNYISTLDSRIKKPSSRMLTGMLTLDYLLNGFMEGSLYEVSGKPGAGKSTLSWKIIEKLQYIYPGISIYYNDIEGTSNDEAFLNRFPLLKRGEIMIDSNPDIETFFGGLEDICNIVDLVFIDTVAMMDPKNKIDMEKSEMGKIAGLMTRGWKRYFDIARGGVRMVAINQLRDNLDPYSANVGPKTPGGNAYHYALTGQIEIKRDGGQSKADKDKDIFGNEKVRAWDTIIKIHKNKQGPFGKSINTCLNTDEENNKFVTFDELKELISFSEVFGFIERSGAMNTIYSTKDGTEVIKLKGKDALNEYLAENIDTYIDLKMGCYREILPKNFLYNLYDKLVMIARGEKDSFTLKNILDFEKPVQVQLEKIILKPEETLEDMKKKYPIDFFLPKDSLKAFEEEYGKPWKWTLREFEEEEEEDE